MSVNSLQAAVPSIRCPAVASAFQTDGRKHLLLPFRRKLSFPSARHTVRQLKPITLKLHNFYHTDFRWKAIPPLPMDAICSSYPFHVYLQARTIINIESSTNKAEPSARPYPFPGSLESSGGKVLSSGRPRHHSAPVTDARNVPISSASSLAVGSGSSVCAKRTTRCASEI